MIPLGLMAIIVFFCFGLAGIAVLLYRSEPFRELFQIVCFVVGFVTICLYTGSWIGHMIYSFSKLIGVL